MTGSRPAPLVDVAWLAEHLLDQDVVLLQVDGDASSYYARHLPCSQPLDWQDDLHDPVRRAPPSPGDLQRLLQHKGVTPDSHVVLYGTAWPGYAAHALWLLRWFRHERLSLLDGGLRAWVRSGLPVTAELPPARPAPPYHLPEPDEALRAVRDQVLQRYVSPEPGVLVLVLHCRTPAEFEGHVTQLVDVSVDRDRVSGHIPGARNLPSEQLLDDAGLFRPVDDLRRLFAEAGLTASSDAMVYCRVSERSALLWFALHELLGHAPTRHYDGGWAEYGSLVDVPVVREVD